MLAIAALLLSIAAAPQEVPAPRVYEAIQVELVNVDVFFTYEFTLQVRPRAGRVSIGVIDDVSKEFGAQVVDLPNFPTSS